MAHPIKQLIITFFTFTTFGGTTLLAQQDTDLIVGSKFSINSTILGEERTMYISLPDSYADLSIAQKKYPIMILLDGYTHFKTAAGIVHFMGSDSNGNRMIPETIIVAIENIDREKDFTITKIKTKRPNTMGGGKNFLGFIEKELIPYVDKNYNTKTHRILAAHSLGGLLTLNAYMDENSLFDAYIAIDPSIWWSEQLMTEKVYAISPSVFKKKLYIATANQGDDSYVKNKKRHDTFYAVLEKRAEGAIKVKIEYFENESHRSVPLIAFYQGLRYLYEEH